MLAITHTTQVDAAHTQTIRRSPFGTAEWNEGHTLTGTADIAQGGTGASTAAGARVRRWRWWERPT